MGVALNVIFFWGVGRRGEGGPQVEKKVQWCLPPLSDEYPRVHAAAVAIDESESEQGQVLLIGGNSGPFIAPEVHKDDLATGVCTPLPPLLSRRRQICTAARLPDGRVVCVGKNRGRNGGDTGGAAAR
jgi:hypothetical protein